MESSACALSALSNVCFRHRHQLVFSWLLGLPLVYGERANLQALAGHGPEHLASQPYRRLLCAAYWGTKPRRWWFADQARQALPPPEDGILDLVGDSPSTRNAVGPCGSMPPAYGCAMWETSRWCSVKVGVTRGRARPKSS